MRFTVRQLEVFLAVARGESVTGIPTSQTGSPSSYVIRKKDVYPTLFPCLQILA